MEAQAEAERQRQKEELSDLERLLLEDAEAGVVPSQCFQTDSLVNFRGSEKPILSDADMSPMQDLTADHVLTQMDICYNSRQIVGL